MKYDVEQIINAIIQETGLSRKEIQDRVKAKQEDMKGLINEESATIIVAKALGVDVSAGDYAVVPSDVDVKDITDGMRSVTVRGMVTQVFPVRTFSRNDGSQGTVGSLFVRDNTGEVRVVLWDELTRAIADNLIGEGDIIRLSNGYTKQGRDGGVEVHGGRMARLQVGPDDLSPEDFESKAEREITPVNQVNLNSRRFNVEGIVLKKFPSRSFNKKDGSPGQVANLVLGDDTGQITVTFWNDQVEIFDSLTEGDRIVVENAYPKKNFRDPQVLDLNLGASSKVTRVASGEDVSELNLQKISSLVPSQKLATVEGEIVAVEGLRQVNRRAGGTVALFTFNLADDSGVIRVAAWADLAQVLSEKLEVGSTVRIVNASVRVNQYSNSVELTIQDVDSVKEVGSLNFQPVRDTQPTSRLAGGDSGGSGGGPANRNYARFDIDEVDAIEGRKPVEVRGMVVRTNIFRYRACPQCRKKKENCTCGTSSDFEWKVIVTLKVEDDSDSIDVKFFNEQAEELVEIDATFVGELDEDSFAGFKETFDQKMVGKEFVVQGRSSFSSFSNRNEVQGFTITPVDPISESHRLLAELNSS
ncbi:MAG: DUF2240 family protein [Promethearchaeota archaeon]